MHAVDPQWRPDVIRAAGAPGMAWERWSEWRRGDARWAVTTLDNTELGVAETAARVSLLRQQHQEAEAAARAAAAESSSLREALATTERRLLDAQRRDALTFWRPSRLQPARVEFVNFSDF